MPTGPTPTPSPSPLPEVVVHIAHHTDWLAILTFIGSGIAAAGAVLAATIAAKAYMRQGAVLKQQQADRHREHASRISVRPDRFERTTRGAYTFWADGAELQNSSDEPVHRCIVSFVDPRDGTTIATSEPMRVLAPRSVEVAVPLGDGDRPIEALKRQGVGYDVEVSFVDRNGVRWRRDRHGGLHDDVDEPSAVAPDLGTWASDTEGNSVWVPHDPSQPVE